MNQERCYPLCRSLWPATVLAAHLVLAASCLAGGQDRVVPQALKELKPGHWYEVPDSRIRPHVPKPTPPGNPKAIITAWNSGAYDSRRQRLLVTGGGHNDYGGNEI